jgi:hypothetical protein
MPTMTSPACNPVIGMGALSVPGVATLKLTSWFVVVTAYAVCASNHDGAMHAAMHDSMKRIVRNGLRGMFPPDGTAPAAL